MTDPTFPQVGVFSSAPVKDLASSPTLVDLESPVPGVASITKSDTGAISPGRLFAIICTAAGDVKVSFADGSTYTFPVSVGHSLFPFQITRVWSTGTTATATFANMG